MDPYTIESYGAEFCSFLPYVCHKFISFSIEPKTSTFTGIAPTASNSYSPAFIYMLPSGVPEIPQVAPRKKFINISQSFAKLFLSSIIHRLTRRHS